MLDNLDLFWDYFRSGNLIEGNPSAASGDETVRLKTSYSYCSTIKNPSYALCARNYFC